MRDDELLEEDPMLAAVVRELRRPVAPTSQAAERALATLTGERRRRRAGWPLAAAAVLVIAWSLSHMSDAARPVRFALQAPASAQVTLIGDFNDWDPHQIPLHARAGEWSATVRLRPGRYRYSFVVDGSRWVADPQRAATTDDDFGTPTSVITVAH
ncbi:MAG: isoamylase early set domain-containing protein [Gemmatimonadota bacterium]